MPQAKIKRALYFSALNKLKAELSDLEVKEMIIVNNPVAVLSDGHNEHAEELKENLKKQINNKNDNSSNFELVLKKMEKYSAKKIDRNMITEVIKIQSLVGELKNGNIT